MMIRVLHFTLILLIVVSQIGPIVVKAEPLEESEIWVHICRITERDQFETLTWPPPFGQDGADWRFVLKFFDGETWTNWESKKELDNSPDARNLKFMYHFTFEMPPSHVLGLKFKLWDSDGINAPDLADISSHEGNGLKNDPWLHADLLIDYESADFYGEYSLNSHSFTNGGDYVERWYCSDSYTNYAFVTSGEFDGSYGDNNWDLDAEVRFEIYEEIPDELKPWLDENQNGLPDYLDSSSFSVSNYTISTAIPFSVFGEIDWPISIQIVEPAFSHADMLDKLRNWGVDCSGNYYFVLPLIFDIDITDLSSKLSQIFPVELLNYLRQQACGDGHLRFLSFLIVDSIEGFEDYIDLLMFLKQLILGKATEALETLFEFVDISFYTIGYCGSVCANKIISVRDLLANDLVQLVIDLLQIVVELPALPANVVQVGKKVFSFIVDYAFDYLPIPAGIQDSANWIKGVMNSADPPDIRLNLQVYNSSTGQLLLGYNATSNTTLTSCYRNETCFGLWFEDPDKQTFILAKQMSPYNATISCSNSTNDSINMTYSFVLYDPAFNKSHVSGGSLVPGEQTTTQVIIDEENKTLIKSLKPVAEVSPPHPIHGESVLVNINVTDTLGNFVTQSDISVFVRNQSIPVTSLGGGKFEAIVDTSKLRGYNLVYVYANKTGYFRGMDIEAIYVAVLPVADFTWNPAVPKVDELVTFNASASTPNGGSITSYEWDFGDGEYATGQIVTHTFSSADIYAVGINVTDSEGLWDTEQKQIQVVQPHGPEAEFTAIPGMVNVGALVEFDASSSLPGFNGTHEMPITEYRWDFADGEKTTTFTPIVYHSFESTGIYHVEMTVYAPGATPETDSTTHRVTVREGEIGGDSFPVRVYTTTEPLMLYVAIVAILASVSTLVKRRTRRRTRES